MEWFINFFLEYWTIIVPCLLGVVEFIFILIFKKRPQIIDNSLTEFILKSCYDAEKIFGKGNGSEKYKYVVKLVTEKLGKVNYLIFASYVDRIIETILGCQSKYI